MFIHFFFQPVGRIELAFKDELARGVRGHAQLMLILNLHFQGAPAFTRFAPCEFVYGGVVGDFSSPI